MNCVVDMHLCVLVIIIIVIGAFGGLLNYLHNFDKADKGKCDRIVMRKYILLGVGAAILVPVFLKMIASDLINRSNSYDNINYLIFAGFCLVAAIFSKQFISTIGDRILEAAKNAEITSKEVRSEVETTKLELNSTQERIEDVKAAINLNNFENELRANAGVDYRKELLTLVDSFVEKTSINDYRDRVKMKAEIGRKMGQIIIRHNLCKEELLEEYPKEGMYLALAYSIELKPESSSLELLNKLCAVAFQLYTRYVILNAYRTLASSGLILRDQVIEIKNLIENFRKTADKSLIRDLDNTINVLRLIEPEI